MCWNVSRTIVTGLAGQHGFQRRKIIACGWAMSGEMICVVIIVARQHLLITLASLKTLFLHCWLVGSWLAISSLKSRFSSPNRNQSSVPKLSRQDTPAESSLGYTVGKLLGYEDQVVQPALVFLQRSTGSYLRTAEQESSTTSQAVVVVQYR